MDPVFFETPADFGIWLARNHDRAEVLWVGFYKKGSGRPSLTWPESVDEALCYGWIDGVRLECPIIDPRYRPPLYLRYICPPLSGIRR